MCLARPVLPVVVEPRVQGLVQFVPKIRPRVESDFEALPDVVVYGTTLTQPFAPVLLVDNPSLCEVHERNAPVDQRIEQVEQHLPFPSLTARVAHVERRAGREADKVKLAVRKAGLAFAGCQLRRQHGEAGRERKRPFVRAPHLELG